MGKNNTEAELIRLRNMVSDMAEANEENEHELESIAPIYTKPLLTVDEASLLFNLGTKKIYQLANGRDANFILKVGNKILIKRQRFEDYLMRRSSI